MNLFSVDHSYSIFQTLKNINFACIILKFQKKLRLELDLVIFFLEPEYNNFIDEQEILKLCNTTSFEVY